MDDLAQLLPGADAARPLTDELRSRLESALLGRSTAVESDFRGIDEARPLPPKLHDKLRRRLERRRVAAWQIASAITAAAAVIIGIVVVPGTLRKAERPPAALQPAPKTPGGAAGEGSFPQPSPTITSSSPGLPRVLTAPGMGYEPAYRGSAPPFSGPAAYPQSPPAPAVAPGSGQGGPPSDPPPAPPPVPARIAITGADPAIRAGFNAYVELVRTQGEVGNRTFEIVAASAKDVLVTVNLGAAPLGQSSSVPVLETLDVAASMLTGTVFDVASTPRRQARVLVDRIISTTDLESESTPSAVIYRAGGGEFADAVPSEVAALLREAGVLVFDVDYVMGRTTLIPADIAFVLMPPTEARSFAREARTMGYAPRLGLAGIWSLYDDAVRGELGTTAYAVSPYWSNSSELGAIKRGVEARGARMGAGAVHGWAAAKRIAVALYETDPRTAGQMSAALGRWVSLGVCTYNLRPGTHERKPDGIMLEIKRDGVRAVSGELTDPRA